MKPRLTYSEQEVEGLFTVRFKACTERRGRELLAEVPTEIGGYSLARALVTRRYEVGDDDGCHFSRGAMAEVRLEYLRTDQGARVGTARADELFGPLARRAAA